MGMSLTTNFCFLSVNIAKVLGKDLTQDFVLEIGSGPGSLTRPILELNAKKFCAIEKDKRFKPLLEVSVYDRTELFQMIARQKSIFLLISSFIFI